MVATADSSLSVKLLSAVRIVMMSVAAYKAAWQLIHNPSLWEKTAHGLTANPAAAPPLQRTPHRLAS